MPRVTLSERFAYDPGRANAGYLAGWLSRALGGEAEVEFFHAPLTGRALTTEPAGEKLLLVDHGDIVAEARPAHLAMPVPNAVTLKQALAASSAYAEAPRHPLTSFAGGTHRDAGDGLRLFAGPVPGRLLHAAAWDPDPAFADEAGVVYADFLWPALECAAGLAAFFGDAPTGRLGSIAVRSMGPVETGVSNVVTAWPLDSSRDTRTSGAAAFSEDGVLRAFGHMVWLTESY